MFLGHGVLFGIGFTVIGRTLCRRQPRIVDVLGHVGLPVPASAFFALFKSGANAIAGNAAWACALSAVRAIASSPIVPIVVKPRGDTG